MGSTEIARAGAQAELSFASRIFGAEDELLALGCDEHRLPFGRLLVDPAHPSISDVNCLRSLHALPSPRALDEVFRTLVAPHGCKHRRLACREPQLIGPLDDLLLPRGYEAHRCVAMALRSDVIPAWRADVSIIEVAHDDEPLAQAIFHCQDQVRREELWYRTSISEQADELTLRQLRLGKGTWLAACTPDREVLASLQLFFLGGTAFLSDLGTAPRHRGRGLASALIAHAASSARDRRSTLVLTARAEEEPQRLYARLGFEVVGEGVDWLRGW